jgi:hypothetical protein
VTLPAAFTLTAVQPPDAGPTQPEPLASVQKRVKCTRTRKVPGETAFRLKDS